MDSSKKLVYFFINLLIFIEICKAGRYGGGSRSRSGGFSRSRPSSHTGSGLGWNTASHPSPSRNIGWGSSVSHPSPSRYNTGYGSSHISPSRSWGASASHPSPSHNLGSSAIHSSAPNYGWSLPAAKPAPIITHPTSGVGVDRTQIRPTQTGIHPASSSVGWNVNSKPQQPSAPPLDKSNVNSVQTHPNPTSLSYPPSHGFKPNAPPLEKSNAGSGVNTGNIGWNLPPAPRPGGLSPTPIGPPLHNNPSNNHPGGYQPGGYHIGHNNPTGYSPGGYNPGGYHNPGGYNPGGYHQPGNFYNPNGPSKVKIINQNHYYAPGHYSLPQPHYQYPGYYYSPTSYHYSSNEVGSGALGFFLGYSLAKMTTPTFGHYSFYDGYRPRYDHYTVHHYYHDKESVPNNPVVQSNSIIGCVGDSSSICPQNTISLCTSNGNIMCVASIVSTAPCSDNRQLNCVRTEVPCINATNCTNPTTNTTSVSIPCISTAKVVGEIQTINNTIVGNNPNATIPSMTSIPTTISPITTTLVSQNWTNATVITRKRRQVNTQNFCVTIVAMPAKKETTEGEKLYSDSKSLLTKFFEKAWGL